MGQVRMSKGKRRFVVNVTGVGRITGDGAGHLVDARTDVLALGGPFPLELPDAAMTQQSGPRQAP